MEALAAAFAMTLINPVMDAMVRPEFVVTAMSKGELEVIPGSVKKAVGVAEPGKPEPQWTFDRSGVDELVVYAMDSGGQDPSKPALVFERSGFANWKLTGLRRPHDLLK